MESRETDLKDDSNEIVFMIIEYTGSGFFLEAVNKKESKCGSCHSKDGESNHENGACSGCQQ